MSEFRQFILHFIKTDKQNLSEKNVHKKESDENVNYNIIT